MAVQKNKIQQYQRLLNQWVMNHFLFFLIMHE